MATKNQKTSSIKEKERLELDKYTYDLRDKKVKIWQGDVITAALKEFFKRDELSRLELLESITGVRYNAYREEYNLGREAVETADKVRRKDLKENNPTSSKVD